MSGFVLEYLYGLRFVMLAGYKTALPTTAKLPQTGPHSLIKKLEHLFTFRQYQEQGQISRLQ